MNGLRKLFVLTCFLFLLIPIWDVNAEDGISYPKPSSAGYVNDYANILDTSSEQSIINIGHELDNKTKAQIVVVTLDKIPGNTSIEEYANGLFRNWGIGDKALKNGILLLVNVDPGNRAVRVEVGDGLEGRVPDAIANRIIQEILIPYYKQGDYNSGTIKGYYELCNKVAEEYDIVLSGKPSNTYSRPKTARQSNIPFIIFMLILFVFDGAFLRWRIMRFIFYIIASSRFRGGGGGGGFGGGSGGGFGGFGGGSSSGGGSTGKW